MPEPANEIAPGPVTVPQVRGEFERVLKDRTHVGVRNFLGDALLEPRNPFERERRMPKRWVVVLGVLLSLALLIVYSFHVR
jgi:hypothetical protein